jgi:hypothetical protein
MTESRQRDSVVWWLTEEDAAGESAGARRLRNWVRADLSQRPRPA